MPNHINKDNITDKTPAKYSKQKSLKHTYNTQETRIKKVAEDECTKRRLKHV